MGNGAARHPWVVGLVMTDILGEIFTPEVLSRLGRTQNPSDRLRDRLQVLSACGPYPSEYDRALQMAGLRGRKAAWETYLTAAKACGLLEGDDGKELWSRLTGIRDDGFRSAMAECMVCWYFSGVLKLPTTPKPGGRDRRRLEMKVGSHSGDILVEVKAPYRDRPMGAVDHSDILAQKVNKAAKQFPDKGRNILAIVPELCPPLFHVRYPLVRALIGEFKTTWLVDPRTGESVTEPHNKFFRNGKFLNPVRSGGLPGNTRISAVLCIEETWRIWHGVTGVPELTSKHDVLVLHNPLAGAEIPQDIWGSAPQFVPVGDEMAWTDGHDVFK